MNIISPKQVNELDILNEQDKKNIQNLLKKRKNFKKQKSTDPIYSELYVIHEQNKNNKDKKRSKTERDYQSEHSKVHNYPKEKIVGSEIKNHKRSFTSSYSVQLPPVSKLFQSKAKHGNKNQGARAILPSSYIPKKISLPHYQSVILQQNESEKHQMRSVHQKRKYQTIAIQNKGPKQPKKKQMKVRVNSFPTKQRKPSNYGQWKQIDILKLETYFIKLKKNKNLLFSQSRIDNLQQSSQSKNMIPSDIRKVPDFIKSYESTNPDVNINNLIKSTKFGVVFDEGLSLYFGELQKGSKSGYGVLICNNYRFQGLFRNDQKIIGYELTLNGYYRGKFHNNKRQGTGQYIWFNGQSYSGQWKNGVKQGSGVWKSGRGDSYIGQWHNGKVQGYGVHLSSTGQRYEGNFCEFLKSGKGQETFPNGDVYIGEYNQGEANGRGKYVWKNGIVYEGYFKNGYRNGKGILNAQGYLNFQGYFKNDLPNGNGSLNYENGDHYIGSFLDGQKHGQGTLKLKVQQKVLTGEWQRGKFKFQQQQN